MYVHACMIIYTTKYDVYIYIVCIIMYTVFLLQYVAKKSLRSYPNLTSQRFLKLRLRGLNFSGSPICTQTAYVKLPTFRKAFLNCFTKLPEVGKLFNLAYSSHNVLLCEVFPKLPEDFANFSCNVL